MTAISLQLSKQEFWEIKMLAKGQAEWDNLDYEKKKMLYDTGVDLSYRVSEEQIREFEREMAMKGEFGVSGIARAATKEAKERLLG